MYHHRLVRHFHLFHILRLSLNLILIVVCYYRLYYHHFVIHSTDPPDYRFHWRHFPVNCNFSKYIKLLLKQREIERGKKCIRQTNLCLCPDALCIVCLKLRQCIVDECERYAFMRYLNLSHIHHLKKL